MTFVWLASYPKSGNTWLRILLSNYLTETGDSWDWHSPMIGPPSHLERHGFDEAMGVASADVASASIDRFRREHHAQFVRKFTGISFAKTHEAFLSRQDGQPMFPNDRDGKAIYLVRNPLDIAASYAHHEGSSIDRIIDRMGDCAAVTRNGDASFDEHLGSWSDHVAGWIDQPDIDVLVIRYEDLADNTHASFANIVRFCGLNEDAGKIDRAVSASQFSRLQSMERDQGFKALMDTSREFFRRGRTEGWRTELNARQVETIVTRHGRWMERLSYRGVNAA